MSRAIGTILLLYALTNIFSDAVDSFETASVAAFNTIETAANISQLQLKAGFTTANKPTTRTFPSRRHFSFHSDLLQLIHYGYHQTRTICFLLYIYRCGSVFGLENV